MSQACYIQCFSLHTSLWMSKFIKHPKEPSRQPVLRVGLLDQLHLTTIAGQVDSLPNTKWDHARFARWLGLRVLQVQGALIILDRVDPIVLQMVKREAPKRIFMFYVRLMSFIKLCHFLFEIIKSRTIYDIQTCYSQVYYFLMTLSIMGSWQS